MSPESGSDKVIPFRAINGKKLYAYEYPNQTPVVGPFVDESRNICSLHRGLPLGQDKYCDPLPQPELKLES